MEKCFRTYFGTHCSRFKRSIKSIRWTFPKKYLNVYICLYSCLWSWTHFYSETIEHNGQSQKRHAVCRVCFNVNASTDLWSLTFMSLNQIVHLRSKGGQMSYFTVCGNFDLALHDINVCVFMHGTTWTVCPSMFRFTFTSFLNVFLLVFVSETVTYA